MKTVVISVVGFLLVTGSGLLDLSGQEQPPSGVTFRVVSVRVLSHDEATARTPDVIGSNIAVRLRLSCAKDGIYFFTWKDDFIPLGYDLKLTDHGSVWLAGRSGSEPVSPGLQKLTLGMPGVWRRMSARGEPAIEWEEDDSTNFAGEKHARTIFVKLNEGDKPIEIISESYLVPASQPTAK